MANYDNGINWFLGASVLPQHAPKFKNCYILQVGVNSETMSNAGDFTQAK